MVSLHFKTYFGALIFYQFHFCLSFSTNPGEFSFYINGTRAIQRQFFADAVSGQGILLIGHELDSYQNFDTINPREAFV